MSSTLWFFVMKNPQSSDGRTSYLTSALISLAISSFSTGWYYLLGLVFGFIVGAEEIPPVFSPETASLYPSSKLSKLGMNSS